MERQEVESEVNELWQVIGSETVRMSLPLAQAEVGESKEGAEVS